MIASEISNITYSNQIYWPLVSIITPSYNQAAYLEKTIVSVLSQDYPNLEYIIIDGGSTDGSLEIIRKYENRLAYWVSEPDNGQSQAINKGLHRASGEILAWLNSDDRYLPGAICSAAKHMLADQAAIVYGRSSLVTPDGDLLATFAPTPPITFRSLMFVWAADYATLPQPSVFFHRQVVEKVGSLDENLHYTMDHDLWLRALRHFPIHFVDETWSLYTVHPQSKTGRGWKPFAEEFYTVGRRHWRFLGWPLGLWYLLMGHRMIFARRYIDDAFDAYKLQEWKLTLTNLLQAVCRNPAWLLNRGVSAIGARSFYNLLAKNRKSSEI